MMKTKTPKCLIVCSAGSSLIGFRRQLILDLQKSGYSVHAIVPSNDYSKKLIDECRLIKCSLDPILDVRASSSVVGNIFYLLSLSVLVLRIKPNLLFLYTAQPVIFGCIAGRMARVPRIVCLISGLGFAFTGEERSKSLLSKIIRFLYRFCLSFSNIVFFHNKDDLQLFKKYNILSKLSGHGIVVPGSGVDVTYFGYRPPTVNNKFLMIGRLLGDKGVREYLCAASLVKLEFPDAKFELIGGFDRNPDGLKSDEFYQLLRNSPVDYLGQVDDVRQNLEGCSVFVLPSYREGLPRSALEAMAIGRPILTTDAPGCRETVMDYQNGRLVPSRDAKALASAMVWFMKNKDKHLVLGKQSRRMAEDQFCVHAVNKMMLNEILT